MMEGPLGIRGAEAKRGGLGYKKKKARGKQTTSRDLLRMQTNPHAQDPRDIGLQLDKRVLLDGAGDAES